MSIFFCPLKCRRATEAAGTDTAASLEDQREVFVTLVGGGSGLELIGLRGLPQKGMIVKKDLAAQAHSVALTGFLGQSAGRVATD